MLGPRHLPTPMRTKWWWMLGERGTAEGQLVHCCTCSITRLPPGVLSCKPASREPSVVCLLLAGGHVGKASSPALCLPCQCRVCQLANDAVATG